MAPIVWMLGKVQSGKSSIVRALTRSTEAEVGQGFAACTHGAHLRLPRRCTGDPLPRHARARRAELRCARGPRLLRAAGAPRARRDEGDGSRPRSGGGSRGAGAAAPSRVAGRGRPNVAARGLRAGRGAPGHLSLRARRCASGADGGSAARPAAKPRGAARGSPGCPAPSPVAFVALDFTRESDGYRPADYGHDALIETLRATAPAGLVSSLQAAHARRAAPASAPTRTSSAMRPRPPPPTWCRWRGSSLSPACRRRCCTASD